MFPQDLVYGNIQDMSPICIYTPLGYYTKDKTTGAAGKLDVAMVEVTGITEEGKK
jgi:hypothetical protein